MKFTGFPSAALSLPYAADESSPSTDLGTKIVSDDGREYRYVKAGASALVAGQVQQAPAEITNHQNLTPVAAAVGDTTLSVTLGATALTANYYAGGYALVTVTPGLGQIFEIKSHPAADASAAVVLTLEEPIQVALTTSSRIDLVPNPYNGVVVNPTTPTSCPVGVACNDITAGQYGWVQTKGIANVQTEGTIVVGTPVYCSNGTAGAVEDAQTATEQVPVGVAATGVGSGENGAIFLNIS